MLTGVFFALAASSTDDLETGGNITMVAASVIFIGIIFLACWVWARWHPFPAALTALVVFITVHAADAFMDPTSLASGFLLKIFFLLGLSQAVSSAYKLKKSARQPLN